jgi:hypothetical protein
MRHYNVLSTDEIYLRITWQITLKRSNIGLGGDLVRRWYGESVEGNYTNY